MKKIKMIDIHTSNIRYRLNQIWKILEQIYDDETGCNEGSLTIDKYQTLRKYINEIDTICEFYQNLSKELELKKI